ncbi:MAG: Hsp20/alpha crystallin family protein [Parcubacteria group bacterium]|nr:Hsp20/alpha crystallin family protein [Parcubacteria group bacterium]
MKKSFFQLITGREPIGEEEEYEQRYKEILAAAETASTKNRVKNELPAVKSEKKIGNVKVNFETEEEGLPSEGASEEGQLTIDVYQTPEEMVIKSTIAGVRQDDLDITIATDMVTIQGVRRKDDNISPEDYYYQELYWGPFSRSVILPQEVDTESAKAALKDGILTIRLPKFERGRTKKLRINSV